MSSDTYRVRVVGVEGAEVVLEIAPTTAGDLCSLPGTRSLVLMLLSELGEPGLAQVLDPEWVEKHVDEYVVQTVVEKIVGCVLENHLRHHALEDAIPLGYLQPRTTLRATMKSAALADRFAAAVPFGTTAFDVWWKDPLSFEALDGKKRKISQRQPGAVPSHTLPPVYEPDPARMGKLSALLASRLVGWTQAPVSPEEAPPKGKKKPPLMWPPAHAELMKSPIGDKAVGAAPGDCTFVLSSAVASLHVSIRAATINLRDSFLIATELRVPRAQALVAAAIEAGVAELEAAPGPAAKKKPFLRFFANDAKAIEEAGSTVASGWLADPSAAPGVHSGSRWFPRWAGDPSAEVSETLEGMADRLAGLLNQPALARLLTAEGVAGLTETHAEAVMKNFGIEGFARLAPDPLGPELSALRWNPEHPGRLAMRIAVHAALGNEAAAREAAIQIRPRLAREPGFGPFFKSIGVAVS
jgi:hypothetical protein